MNNRYRNKIWRV